LALVPKCPACVAGYVAAVTGVGVSMPVAAGLRWGLVGVCLVALSVVAVRQGWKLIEWGTRVWRG
jgi:hypothetical protein